MSRSSLELFISPHSNNNQKKSEQMSKKEMDGVQSLREQVLSKPSSRSQVPVSGIIHSDNLVEAGVATEIKLISVNDAEETFKVSVLIHVHFTLGGTDEGIDFGKLSTRENKTYQKYSKPDEMAVDGFERVHDFHNIYTPTIVMVNCIDTQLQKFDETVRFNKKTGIIWISYYNTLTIAESLELQKFPFDRQLFRILFKSPDAKLVDWKLDTEMLDFPLPRDAPKDGPQSRARHVVACELKNWFMIDFIVETHQEDNDPASLTKGEFSITIRAERDPKYFFFNFFVALFFIVLANVTSVSISPEFIADRHSLNLTVFLTLVAYKFVLITATPKVGYLTYIDYYVILGYLFTFASAVENIMLAPVIACKFNEGFDCDDPLDLVSLALEVKGTDDVFYLVYGILWVLINLGMAIICFFPSLVRYDWDTVEDRQIGVTKETLKSQVEAEDGLANDLKRQARQRGMFKNLIPPSFVSQSNVDEGRVEVFDDL